MYKEIIEVIKLFYAHKVTRLEDVFKQLNVSPTKQAKIIELVVKKRLVVMETYWGIGRVDYSITDDGDELAKQIFDAENLDRLLLAFANQPHAIRYEQACDLGDVEVSENRRLILLSDGYIKSIGNLRTHFLATVEGKRFIKVDGGYIKELIDDRLLNKDKEEPVKKWYENQTLQKYLGWGVALIVAIAGIAKTCAG